MRHISDDEWSKESKKFNRDNSFHSSGRKNPAKFNNKGDNKRKDFEQFDRDSRKERNDSFKGNYKDRSRDEEEKGDFRFKDASRKPGGNRRSRDGEIRREFGGANKRRPEGVNYDPSKSKGPRLPESSETIINPVHLRKRKNK